MMEDLERQLLEAERPELEAAMRARVLAATMPLVRPEASRLDRVWFSPKWRTAAVLALVVLAGVELAPRRSVKSAPMPLDRATTDITQAVATAAREVGLRPDDTAALCAQAIAAARAAISTAPEAGPLGRGSDQ